MALQAQWGLEKTADSAISISRGLLQAATSDNVHPMAIMACERFGNTIAMCPDTCRKVEKTVLPTPPHAVLQFIRGTVGYSTNDCATYFGASQAGLQFLGLAAALVTSMDTLLSATCIHKMLVDSASDKSLVPTLMQMEDLMNSLEPRCRRSRFTDEVVGWHCLLGGLISQRDEKFGEWMIAYKETPSADSLKGVVDAFRELHRIGDSGAERAVFTVTFLAPWLAAFTKWCLGSPPSVYMHDGTALLETLNSKVRIQILHPEHEEDVPLKATVEYLIDSPRELARFEPQGTWCGLVGIQAYCCWLLRELSVDRGSALTAVQAVIADAVRVAVANISFVAPKDEECYRAEESNAREKFPDMMLQPLGETSHVLGLMFEGSESAASPDSQVSIFRNPAVREHIKATFTRRNLSELNQKERKKLLLRALARITASVLALSLYQNPESLRVLTTTAPRSSEVNGLASKVLKALAGETKVSCPVRLLIDEAMALVGHYGGRRATGHRVVMSSFGGQTVYFSFLETNLIAKHGYLSLSWQPGVIWYGADKHHIVHSGSNQNPYGMLDHLRLLDMPITRPLNLCPGASLKWIVVHEGRRKGLKLSLTLDGHTQTAPPSHESVELVVTSLARSVILKDCPHDKNSGIDPKIAKFCLYSLPGYRYRPSSVNIEAVDGSDALRFFSCAGLKGSPAVIRGEACMNCCVEVCREAGIRFVIL